MKIAVVTITYNRLALTKQTVDSFYKSNKVDYHLFIDNGSIDGTQEWLSNTAKNYVLLDKNYGIAYAFAEAVGYLRNYDFILKLDNDIETVTDDIINKMLQFYESNGINYVCAPVDLLLDRAYSPVVLSETNLNGYNVHFTTHTGGAFQMIPYSICDRLCKELRHLKCGDYMIGKYFRRHGYRPTYLLDLEMRHIGLNQTCKNYVL